MNSKCSEILTPFFENDMITEEGQDVLRYDPSLNEQSPDRMIQYHNQRFAPLLDCLPAKMTGIFKFVFFKCIVNQRESLYSVLTKSMSGPEKWEKIKGIFYV